MTYICSNCTIVGSGVPFKTTCPCCGHPLKIKFRSTGEDTLDGEYFTVTEVASEILQIVETFKHTKSQLIVSPDVDIFLKKFFSNISTNYIIDAKLKDFQMIVK